MTTHTDRPHNRFTGTARDVRALRVEWPLSQSQRELKTALAKKHKPMSIKQNQYTIDTFLILS